MEFSLLVLVMQIQCLMLKVKKKKVGGRDASDDYNKKKVSCIKMLLRSSW